MATKQKIQFIWQLPVDVRGLIGDYLTLSDIATLKCVCKRIFGIFPESTNAGKKIKALYFNMRSYPEWSALKTFAKLDCLEELHTSEKVYGDSGTIQIMTGYLEGKNKTKLMAKTPPMEIISYSAGRDKMRYFSIIAEVRKLFTPTDYLDWIIKLFPQSHEPFLSFCIEFFTYAANPVPLAPQVEYEGISQKVEAAAILLILQDLYGKGVSSYYQETIRWMHCHLSQLLNIFKYYLEKKFYKPEDIISNTPLKLQELILRWDNDFFDEDECCAISSPYTNVIEYWHKREVFSDLDFEFFSEILNHICKFEEPETFKRRRLLLEIILEKPHRVEQAKEMIFTQASSTIIIEMIKILRDHYPLEWEDIENGIGSRTEISATVSRKVKEIEVRGTVKRWAEESGFIPNKKSKTEVTNT
jgi:antitoxin component HigA of HigAB toxin-antitoxin module